MKDVLYNFRFSGENYGANNICNQAQETAGKQGCQCPTYADESGVYIEIFCDAAADTGNLTASPGKTVTFGEKNPPPSESVSSVSCIIVAQFPAHCKPKPHLRTILSQSF